MRFAQIDVFAESAYGGNPVAVFPDAASLTSLQMGRIASEMNLSETTFVTAISKGGYTVRIFTPTEELPFAGHPTLGTAWFLRHEGMLDGDRTTQRSAAGATVVTAEGEMMWFERQGTCSPDLIEQRSDASIDIDIEVTQGSEIGRPSKLHIRAIPKHVAVGGRCEPVLTGELLCLP